MLVLEAVHDKFPELEDRGTITVQFPPLITLHVPPVCVITAPGSRRRSWKFVAISRRLQSAHHAWSLPIHCRNLSYQFLPGEPAKSVPPVRPTAPNNCRMTAFASQLWWLQLPHSFRENSTFRSLGNLWKCLILSCLNFRIEGWQKTLQKPASDSEFCSFFFIKFILPFTYSGCSWSPV